MAAQHDGNDLGDVIGTFISGVEVDNVITAEVSDADGEEDIYKVVFDLDGQVREDTNPADGWSATLDMGDLAQDSILTVVAYDRFGLESEPYLVTVEVISLPGWLSGSYSAGVDMGDWHWSSSFIADELAYKFEGGCDPVAAWGIDISGCAFFNGEHNVQPPKISAWVKFYIDGTSEIGGSAEITAELFGGDLSGKGELSGKLTEALKLAELTASLQFSLEYEIPTPWSIYLPYFGDQGLTIVVSPRGEIEAVFHTPPPDENLQFREMHVTLGIAGGAKAKFGDEDLSIIAAYAEVYMLGDGTIVMMYSPTRDPAFYIDEAELSVWGGVAAKLGWSWLGYCEIQREMEPYTWTVYEGIAGGGGEPASQVENSVVMRISPTVLGGLELTSLLAEGPNEIGPYAWTLHGGMGSGAGVPASQVENSMVIRTSPTLLRSLELAPLAENPTGATVEGQNPDSTIISDELPDDFPAVATDKSGSATTVWVHTTDIGMPPKMDVYYSMWNGVRWTVPQPITVNANLELNPAVAYVDGNPMAVWVSDNGDIATADFNTWVSGLEIYYSIWDGSVWGTPGKITDDALGDGMPSIASNGTDVMVVWVRDQDNNMETKSDLDLYYSTWSGFAWSTPVPVTDNDVQDSAPSVAYSGESAVVTWVRDPDSDSTTRDDKEIYYSRWDGSEWSNPEPLTTNSVQDAAPYAACDRENTPAVVWVQTTATGDKTEDAVYFTSLSNNRWTEPETVSDSEPWIKDPVITFDSRNNAIVAWRAYGDGVGDLSYSVRDSRSFLWSPPQILTDDEMVDWQLSIDSLNDQAILVWLKHSCTVAAENGESSMICDDDDVYYQLIPAREEGYGEGRGVALIAGPIVGGIVIVALAFWAIRRGRRATG